MRSSSLVTAGEGTVWRIVRAIDTALTLPPMSER